MTTLNKYAAEICRKYEIHACTDVTGFSFLGHLHEMMDGTLSCRIDGSSVPVFPEALEAADEFLLTAAGQRNRNHVQDFVKFVNVPFAMEEVLYDPQTSGGLLVAVSAGHAKALLQELCDAGLPAKLQRLPLRCKSYCLGIDLQRCTEEYVMHCMTSKSI